MTPAARGPAFAAPLLALVLLAAPAPAAAQVGSVTDGTPWSGSSDQGGGTPRPGDTNRVDIVFDPDESELTTPCEEIVLIQTTQTCLDGVPVDPGALPGFEYQDMEAIDDLPETSGDEMGTSLDNLEGDTTPYYQDTGGGHNGDSNGHSTDSTLEDAPRYPGLGGADNELKFKFETCAFCAEGEDVGHYFGCITWEYTLTAADVATGNPGTSTFTGTSQQPSAGHNAAVDQWSANHDFDFPRG